MIAPVVVDNEGLRIFLESVRPLYDPNNVDSFWQCRQSFRDLLASTFLTELAWKNLSRALDENVEFIKTQHLNFARMQLPNEMAIDISLVDARLEKNKLQCILESTMLGFSSLDADAILTIDIYDLPEHYSNDTFNAHGALRFVERRTLGPGEIIAIDATRTLYRLVACSGPAIVVYLRSRGAGKIAWNFEEGSLREVDGVSLDLVADRLCFVAQLLGEMRSPSSRGPLQKLFSHRSHRVRWAATQALFAVDFGAGLKQLEDAANDPHVSIRETAIRALKQIASE